MKRAEIDELAFKGIALDGDTTFEDEIYWLTVSNVYAYARKKNLPRDVAVEVKAEAVGKLDKALERLNINENLRRAYIRAVKINTELEKMIQPMAGLDGKSKEELLEIILKTKTLIEGSDRN
jgi:hypothetical protein